MGEACGGEKLSVGCARFRVPSSIIFDEIIGAKGGQDPDKGEKEEDELKAAFGNSSHKTYVSGLNEGGQGRKMMMMAHPFGARLPIQQWNEERRSTCFITAPCQDL